MTSGLFIAMEGTDGSGLSTQTELLAGWYRGQGRDVWATKEPSGGPVGLLLRLALTHRLGQPTSKGAFRPLDEATLALLFTADRMDHLAADVLPRLNRDVTVICDRYILSTLAYQSLGADEAWLRALNELGRVPDLTVLIDVPPEVSVTRMSRRDAIERYETRDTLARVRSNFHRLVPVLQAAGQRIAVVDGGGTIEQVHAAIVAEVARGQGPGVRGQ